MMHPGGNKYSEFKVADFINDPFFQDWTLHPTESNESFWQQWTQDNPEKRPIVEEARKIILAIRFTIHRPSEEQVQDSLSRTMSLIDNQHSETPFISGNQARYNDRWLRRIGTWRQIAALLTGFLVLGTALYLYRHRNTIQLETTGYGMLKTIYLPDSSQVVLNAHSSISYDRGWTTNGRRELWLEGEAYFDVRHGDINNREGQRYAGFIVHTKTLNVEVLGTSFDIRQRRGNIEVVLLKGKIKISSPDARFETIWMTPGDKIRYDSAEHRIYRSSAIPEEYASWKDKKLVLTNAPLGEIIRYIEDNYGRTIQLLDPNLANRTVGGEIYLDNLPDALFILSKTLDIDIEEKGDTILFKSK